MALQRNKAVLTCLPQNVFHRGPCDAGPGREPVDGHGAVPVRPAFVGDDVQGGPLARREADGEGRGYPLASGQATNQLRFAIGFRPAFFKVGKIPEEVPEQIRVAGTGLIGVTRRFVQNRTLSGVGLEHRTNLA